MKTILSALLTISLLTVPFDRGTAATPLADLSESAINQRRAAIDRVSDILLVLAKDKDKDKDKDKQRSKDDKRNNPDPEKTKPDRGDKGKSKAKGQSPNPAPLPQDSPSSEGRDEKAKQAPEKPRGKAAEKTTDPKQRGNDKDKDKNKQRSENDKRHNRDPEKTKPDRGDNGKSKAKDQSPNPAPLAPGSPPSEGRDEKAKQAPKKPRGMATEKTTDPKQRGQDKDKDKDKESKSAKTGDRPKAEPAPQPKPAPMATVPSEPSSSQAPKSKPEPESPKAAAAMNGKSRKNRDVKPGAPQPKDRPDTTADKPAPNTNNQERPPMKQTETRGEPTGAQPNTSNRGRMSPKKSAAKDSADNKTSTRPHVAPPSKEAARVLKDQGQRDRKMDAARAQKIDNQTDATNLIHSILGQAGDRPEHQGRPHSDDQNKPRRDYRERLPVEQVGRSQGERERTVDFLIRRFAGNANLNDAPPEFHSRRYDPDFDGRSPRHGGPVGRDERVHRRPDRQHFHGPSHNRRVVYYPSRNEIPPVLLASVFLNRIQAQPLMQSAYRPGVEGGNADFYQNIPETYRSEQAYAVSYPVDPDSAVSRDDIIFQQGSTALADSYSYDLVVDLAEAMKAPALQREKFVIEGHASAEGDYANNLRLSQERSERIARDLVDMGVDPARLLPVGYGEAEAQYAASDAEELRSLDRRVVVFRMTEPAE